MCRTMPFLGGRIVFRMRLVLRRRVWLQSLRCHSFGPDGVQVRDDGRLFLFWGFGLSVFFFNALRVELGEMYSSSVASRSTARSS
jgi:hypothetical protein